MRLTLRLCYLLAFILGFFIVTNSNSGILGDYLSVNIAGTTLMVFSGIAIDIEAYFYCKSNNK